MDKFVSALDNVLVFANKLAAMCIFSMAILILLEILARTVFNYSIKFVWEMGAYLLAASWFLAAGFTLRTSGHVRICILTSKLSPQVARRFDIFATLGGLLVCSLIWVAVLQLFLDSIKYGKTSFTPLQTPLWLPQSTMVIGATLLLLAMIARLYLLLSNKEPDLPFATDE